ncbi:MAG: (Fe-S)-binding protein [Elusimicrobiaceae bacterium]|nr:(Fe-S)-binding protein [Elusimicrobiaceae bacterium]
MKKYKYLNPQQPMPAADTCLSWQNSVVACTRCHACSRVCPSYLLHPQETFSPRGRVQLMRLVLEGKLKNNQAAPLLEQMIRSCMFCAKCSTLCAGTVPVPHQLLAAARTYEISLFPPLLKGWFWLHLHFPKTASVLVKFLFLLRRLGILIPFYPLYPGWLKHLYRILPRRPKTFTKHIEKTEQPDLIYLPSLYAQYVDASVAEKTLQLAHAKQPVIWQHTSSGLEFYLTGNSVVCLQTAKKLLVRWENTGKRKALPLLTDSVEIYVFLKHLPFLFAALPAWQKRAEKLASHVRFVTDYSFPKPPRTQNTSPKTALEDSALLFPVTELSERAQKILSAQVGKNLVECGYSHFPLPAGGMSLIFPAQATQVVLENVKDIARQQIAQIYCLSNWTALELNVALQRYYPTAKAQPFICLFTNYGPVQERNTQIIRRREVKSAR